MTTLQPADNCDRPLPQLNNMTIKLPKLSVSKIFRIRSASKDKNEHADREKSHKKEERKNQAGSEIDETQQKVRSNSLKVS